MRWPSGVVFSPSSNSLRPPSLPRISCSFSPSTPFLEKGHVLNTLCNPSGSGFTLSDFNSTWEISRASLCSPLSEERKGFLTIFTDKTWYLPKLHICLILRELVVTFPQGARIQTKLFRLLSPVRPSLLILMIKVCIKIPVIKISNSTSLWIIMRFFSVFKS